MVSVGDGEVGVRRHDAPGGEPADVDECGAWEPRHLLGGVPRDRREAEAVLVSEHDGGDAARRQPARDVPENA